MSAPGEAKRDEKELPQSRDIRLCFVFKGTKTSRRDRKEETAKFLRFHTLESKFLPKNFAVVHKKNFAVGRYEKFRRN